MYSFAFIKRLVAPINKLVNVRDEKGEMRAFYVLPSYKENSAW